MKGPSQLPDAPLSMKDHIFLSLLNNLPKLEEEGHIEVVLYRAMGFKHKQIEEFTGYCLSSVERITSTHKDAIVQLSAHRDRICAYISRMASYAVLQKGFNAIRSLDTDGMSPYNINQLVQAGERLSNLARTLDEACGEGTKSHEVQRDLAATTDAIKELKSIRADDPPESTSD